MMTISESVQTTLKAFETYARDNLDLRYNAPTAPWTKGIMIRLRDVGKKNGYYVCVEKKFKADRGEWLYDMTWIKYCGTQPIDIGLVLELEWEVGREDADRKFDKIEYDFQKLLLARADLRCMIFWSATRQSARENIERLIEQVQGFEKKVIGDNYVFCVWLQDEACFKFYPYTV